MLSKCFGGRLVSRSPPEDEIDGDPDEYNHQAGKSCLWTIQKEDRQNHNSAQKIKGWNYRITPGAVGTLHIRTKTAQAKHPRNGQDVKQQSRGNHVIEQIAVEVAIGAR